MDSTEHSTEDQDRLNLRLLESPPEAVIVLSGELDFSNAKRLRAALDRVLAGRPAVRHITVDCADLTFVDSAGIDCLLAARRALRQGGGLLTFRRPSAALKRLLTLSTGDDSAG